VLQCEFDKMLCFLQEYLHLTFYTENVFIQVSNKLIQKENRWLN